MKRKQQLLSASLAAAGMFFLIIDTRTALAGASDGLQLCLRTVIPSLFPFFVLSNILVSTLQGSRISRGLRWLTKLCGTPAGTEGILLVGFLGGYPVGAQSAAQAYRDGHITKQTACRMLAFCSNAGPSFLFGITASLFSSAGMSWLLWGIHIFGAILIAALLPGKYREPTGFVPRRSSVSWTDAMKQGIRNMAAVCGWVIMFRVIITFLDRWVLWLLPKDLATAFTGMLEMTNGCVELNKIGNIGLRFCLCSAFLGFGGICVGLQTASVTRELGTGLYFPGKAAHGLLSFFISYFTQLLFFPAASRFHVEGLTVVFFLTCLARFLTFLLKTQKISSKIGRVRV